MSKPFSFRDLMVVDPTDGSWGDAIGLIAYQYKKRRRGLLGEAAKDKCKECDCEPCVCDESLEAQFDALTPTDEAALTGGQRFDMNRVNAGAMSQDEYNKKYKLGKYRVGSKSAMGGSLYKNLVKKEDVDLEETKQTNQYVVIYKEFGGFGYPTEETITFKTEAAMKAWIKTAADKVPKFDGVVSITYPKGV